MWVSEVTDADEEEISPNLGAYFTARVVASIVGASADPKAKTGWIRGGKQK
jgi:hypothetical protein